MQTVWKYTLAAKEWQTIEMPLGAKILSAEEQNHQIVVYAAIEDTKTDMFEDREIIVLGTGHETHYDLNEYRFLNTVKMENGSLMFHVFVKKGLMSN